MTKTTDQEALAAMVDDDQAFLAEVAAEWPFVTRETEHRALAAARFVGNAIGLPTRDVWIAAGLP